MNTDHIADGSKMVKPPQAIKPAGFDEKLAASIELLRKAEKAFLHKGKLGDALVVAFSGGKDSQAIYHIAEASGVPFVARYNPTTIDHPAAVAFIHQHYPKVVFGKVHISFWDLCVKSHMLPTRIRRFCCNEYKEDATPNVVTVTGVRRAESAKRRNRKELNINRDGQTARKEYKTEDARRRHFEGTIDEFAEGAPEKFRELDCLAGSPRNKVVVNPILDWTEEDVWYYLDTYLGVAHCPIYDLGYKRVGCIFCPMSKPENHVTDARMHPHHFHRLRQTCERLYKTQATMAQHFTGPDQLLAWWMFGLKSGWKQFTAKDNNTLPLGVKTWTELFDELESGNRVPMIKQPTDIQ